MLTYGVASVKRCDHILNAQSTSTKTIFLIKEILDKIQTYLRKKPNVAIDSVSFSEREQEEGESFDFFMSLSKN